MLPDIFEEIAETQFRDPWSGLHSVLFFLHQLIPSVLFPNHKDIFEYSKHDIQ